MPVTGKMEYGIICSNVRIPWSVYVYVSYCDRNSIKLNETAWISSDVKAIFDETQTFAFLLDRFVCRRLQ